MYTYDWVTLSQNRNQHNIVKQLHSNKNTHTHTITSQTLSKIGKAKTLPKSFHEASITLTSKPKTAQEK